MPQLDISAFTPQIIWLFITFIALYLLMAKLALPRVGNILEKRQNKIDDHLDVAQSLRNEANTDAETYENVLAEARERARKAIQDANKEIAIETTRRQKELGIRLSSELKSAEDRIAGAKTKAIDGLHETASEVTMAALKLLLDKTPSEKSVRQAIISALDETNKEMNK